MAPSAISRLAPSDAGLRRRAGHGHDGHAAAFGGVDRDERATRGAGLDDDDQLGQRRQDPVAQWEPEAFGRRARWNLGQEQAALGDVGPQPAVLGGVDHVEPARHDADRSGGCH